jgi:hypothetical protein
MSEREELARLVAEADDKWLRSMKITHPDNPRTVQWNARIDRVLARLCSRTCGVRQPAHGDAQ